MEEEGECLHRRLQQAERERSNQVAGDRIGHQGGDGDVDQVVAAGLEQHGLVLAGGAADAGHGVLLDDGPPIGRACTNDNHS